MIDSNPKRKRRLWPWLVLLAVTVLAIYGYRQAVLAWEDMVRMWRDLVQLFWWIIPDRKSLAKTKPAKTAGEVENDARTEYISRLVSKLHGKSECLVNFW